MVHEIILGLVFIWSGIPQVLTSPVAVQIDDLLETNAMPRCRVRSRFGASNQQSVRLFQGDTLSFNFCVNSSVDVIINDVVLSNDGGQDRISLNIDGEHLGDVTSKEKSSFFGLYWNEFTSSGPIGDTKPLTVGKHTLTLTVEDADLYGVELDHVELGFGETLTADDIRCKVGSKVKVRDETTPCYSGEKKKKKKTTKRIPQVLTSPVAVQIDDLLETNGMPRCRVRSRFGASNQQSVRLFQGDTLSFNFCVNSSVDVIINDVVLSNDGGQDRISLNIDGENLGDVTSRKKSSFFGLYWNEFTSSGPIGDTKPLTVGKHTLTLTVEDADLYGVELDHVKLGFGETLTADDIRCKVGSKVKVRDETTPCYPGEKKKKKKTTKKFNLSSLGGNCLHRMHETTPITTASTKQTTLTSTTSSSLMSTTMDKIDITSPTYSSTPSTTTPESASNKVSIHATSPTVEPRTQEQISGIAEISTPEEKSSTLAQSTLIQASTAAQTITLHQTYHTAETSTQYQTSNTAEIRKLDQISARTEVITLDQTSTTAETITTDQTATKIEVSTTDRTSSIAVQTSNTAETITVNQTSTTAETSTLDQTSSTAEISTLDETSTTAETSTLDQQSAAAETCTSDQTPTTAEINTLDQTSTTVEINTLDQTSTAAETKTITADTTLEKIRADTTVETSTSKSTDDTNETRKPGSTGITVGTSIADNPDTTDETSTPESTRTSVETSTTDNIETTVESTAESNNTTVETRTSDSTDTTVEIRTVDGTDTIVERRTQGRTYTTVETSTVDNPATPVDTSTPDTSYTEYTRAATTTKPTTRVLTRKPPATTAVTIDIIPIIPTLPHGPKRSVILKCPRRQRMVLERRFDFICRRGFSYYNILSYDTSELTFFTSARKQTSRSRYRSPIHSSLGLRSSRRLLHRHSGTYIRCYTGKGKDMSVNMAGSRSAKCPALVFFVKMGSSSRPKPRIVLKQDGSMYFFPNQPLSSQPWYYLPKLDRLGPLELDIQQVTIASIGSAFGLTIRTRTRTIAVLLNFKGQDASVTVKTLPSTFNQENVLLSLAYPCWKRRRRRINAFVNVDSRGYVSLFDYWRRLSGRDIEIVQVMDRYSY